MKQRGSLFMLVLSILIFYIFSCKESIKINQISIVEPNKNAIPVGIDSKRQLLKDTSKVVFFKKQSDVETAFQKKYTVVQIEDLDLLPIERHLLYVIDSFNIRGRKRMDKIQREMGPSAKININHFIIDLSRYKFQLVAATNNLNEKEIWINAFCNSDSRNWRTEIFSMKDGGICYFQCLFNLTQTKLICFLVNEDV